MRAIGASDLPHAAVRVAVQLALHLHVASGRCNPTYATLAVASHLPERSVYRLIAWLEHTGWLAIQRTSGRLSNQYVLLNPDTN
jgi:DNA-binding IclR family transcriptional regulator